MWLTYPTYTASLLVYLFGVIFTENMVMIFILTMLLLAADFYYLKNIAGRRLVGLRWWNEVDPSTGNSQWVFESIEPGSRTINPTDSRFFWLAMYSQPALWVALAVLAIVRFKFMWLPLVGTSALPPRKLVLDVVVLGVPARVCAVELDTLLTRPSICGYLYSHRPHPYRYEQSRLFALRQVQPGLKSCRQRLVRGQHCRGARKQHGQPPVYVWSWLRKRRTRWSVVSRKECRAQFLQNKIKQKQKHVARNESLRHQRATGRTESGSLIPRER